MHGLWTNSRFVGIALGVGVGLLSFAACSSSSSFDEQSFPPLAQTGYGQNAGAAGASAGTAGSGSGGSAAVSSAGSAAVGSSGSAAVSSAGSAGVSGADRSTSSSNGSASAASSAGSGATTSNGCPADIPSLFQRNISQGGCTNNGICHEAGNQKPDLVSPNLVSRLLNVASTCGKTSSGMAVSPRPYIGKTDSFLEEKIAGSPNSDCGFVMPFLMPQALNASDKKCIVDWIHALQATDTQ